MQILTDDIDNIDYKISLQKKKRKKRRTKRRKRKAAPVSVSVLQKIRKQKLNTLASQSIEYAKKLRAEYDQMVEKWSKVNKLQEKLIENNQKRADIVRVNRIESWLKIKQYRAEKAIESGVENPGYIRFVSDPVYDQLKAGENDTENAYLRFESSQVIVNRLTQEYEKMKNILENKKFQIDDKITEIIKKLASKFGVNYWILGDFETAKQRWMVERVETALDYFYARKKIRTPRKY